MQKSYRSFAVAIAPLMRPCACVCMYTDSHLNMHTHKIAVPDCNLLASMPPLTATYKYNNFYTMHLLLFLHQPFLFVFKCNRHSVSQQTSCSSCT